MKQRHVYSVASHGGEYFFYVIEAVLLLNHENPRDTDVYFLPFEPPFASRYKSLRRFFSRGTEQKDWQNTAATTSVFGRVAAGERVRIERGAYAITLRRLSLSWHRRLKSWLSAGLNARKVWKSCRPNSQFQPVAFLQTSYKHVQVGDLAASTYFRLHSRAHELQSSVGLFLMLWWTCWLIDITEELVGPGPYEAAYAITPEPNYVHSAPYRYLRALGAQGLDIYQPNSPLTVLNGTDDISVPRKLQPSTTTSPAARTPDIDEVVSAYFNERLHETNRMLWYMSHGQNDNRSDALADIDWQPVELEPNGLHAVIFLHSFADSQYYFGIDGFASLSDWTYRTVEACLANSSFAKVLIKPHPNANYDVHPSDGRALDLLISRYRRHPRVRILAPNTSIPALCRVGRLVGFTHHGSIAEELVYLGQPVIASTYAWWSTQYRFAQLWSTPDEYRSLISQQTAESWRPPTRHQREELYRFLVDFRFKEVPCDRTFPAFILARLRTGAKADAAVRLRIEEETAYSRELEKLTLEDTEFQQLLDEFEQLAVEPAAVWPLTRAG